MEINIHIEDVNVFSHPSELIEKQLDHLIRLLTAVKIEGQLAMSALDDKIEAVRAAVHEETTEIEGVKVLIQGLRDQITNVDGLSDASKAAIDEIFDTVHANSDSLVAAVNANTDAPAPEVEG